MPKDKNYTEDEHFLSRMYLKEFSEIKKKGNKEKGFSDWESPSGSRLVLRLPSIFPVCTKWGGK